MAKCQSFTERTFSWAVPERIQIKTYKGKTKQKEKNTTHLRKKQILNDTSLTFYLLHTKGFLLTMEFYMKSNLMHTVENLIFKVKDAAENLRQCI